MKDVHSLKFLCVKKSEILQSNQSISYNRFLMLSSKIIQVPRHNDPNPMDWMKQLRWSSDVRWQIFCCVVPTLPPVFLHHHRPMRGWRCWGRLDTRLVRHVALCAHNVTCYVSAPTPAQAGPTEAEKAAIQSGQLPKAGAAPQYFYMPNAQGQMTLMKTIMPGAAGAGNETAKAESKFSRYVFIFVCSFAIGWFL